jgi:hypothetical protein
VQGVVLPPDTHHLFASDHVLHCTTAVADVDAAVWWLNIRNDRASTQDAALDGSCAAEAREHVEEWVTAFAKGNSGYQEQAPETEPERYETATVYFMICSHPSHLCAVGYASRQRYGTQIVAEPTPRPEWTSGSP